MYHKILEFLQRLLIRNTEHIDASIRQIGVLLTAIGIITCILEPAQLMPGGIICLLGLIAIYVASP